MKPTDAQEWLPVLRDYALLLIGLGLAIYGVVAVSPIAASAGFGLAGAGAVGRAIRRIAKIALIEEERP